jgi:hypothetical protein
LLKKYVNIEAADWPLLIGWLTAARLPIGPHPILVLTGEQGTAKSTMVNGLGGRPVGFRAEAAAVPVTLVKDATSRWSPAAFNRRLKAARGIGAVKVDNFLPGLRKKSTRAVEKRAAAAPRGPHNDRGFPESDRGSSRLSGFRLEIDQVPGLGARLGSSVPITSKDG